jgi:hypothetical protein
MAAAAAAVALMLLLVSVPEAQAARGAAQKAFVDTNTRVAAVVHDAR